MLLIESLSEAETYKLGKLIGKHVRAGDIICLFGDLGAGKTIIAKGISKGVGVNDVVTSPTYVLMNQYSGRLNVYHFDIYRLNNPKELYDLDYEEYFYGDGLTIIEWPERMGNLLPKDFLKITIKKEDNIYNRTIIIEPIGVKYFSLEKVLKEI